MKTVKFVVPTMSAIYGRINRGDVVRCGDAEAVEFVDELKCAEYVAPTDADQAGEQKE